MDRNTLEVLSITTSGGVFSLLLYENIKQQHGQDGFLLGKVEYTETKKLTDADHWVINKETVIKVRSVIPCPKQFHFYDSSGQIVPQQIHNFLGSNEFDVVGWYVYRPTRTSTRLLLREKMIHKQLAQMFCLPSQHFSCCILIADWSPNRSTHSLSQSFVRYSNGSFDAIPFHITNLSNSMCTYKSGENASDVINKIMKNLKRSDKLKGHLLVKHVQEELQERVKDLVYKVSEKEKLLYQLDNDVKQLSVNRTKQSVKDLDKYENGLLDGFSE